MNHEETMAWWKEKHPTYFTDMVFSFSQPRLISRMGITEKSEVLEIGFGYGRELSQFCNISKHVCGVELFQYTCELALQNCREQNVKTMPVVGVYDGRRLPYEEQTFDAIYSCFVLQHMSRLAAEALVAECLRVSKPGASILMEFYGEPAQTHPEEDRYSGVPGEGGMYNNGWTREGALDLVRRAGAEVKWYESQSVEVGVVFDNHWVCVTPGE